MEYLTIPKLSLLRTVTSNRSLRSTTQFPTLNISMSDSNIYSYHITKPFNNIVSLKHSIINLAKFKWVYFRFTFLKYANKHKKDSFIYFLLVNKDWSTKRGRDYNDRKYV